MANSIIFGGGCFWCTQAVFEKISGVLSVECGYMGGDTINPSYEDICTGSTNHAEVIKVEFDEDKISLEKLLDIFFNIHNPTTLSKQGNDIGTQYRSVIFYEKDEQKNIIKKSIIEAQKNYSNPIVTKVQRAEIFYVAEEYHQDYFSKNPTNAYCSFVIPPKIEKLNTYYKNEIKK